MIETSIKRAVDATGDNIKVLSDTDGTIVQAVGLVDENGNQSGITANPLTAVAHVKYYDCETLLETNITGMDGALTAINYKDMIGARKIAGHVPFYGFGERVSLSTVATGDDIWEGAATTIPIPNQTAGEQMTLVSTSANDSAAGTGIRQIDVHYLDATGNPQSEIVTLNGTTPVNTVATNIRFVQSLHAETTGTGQLAAGTINIYKLATPATVYNQIAIGGNMSLSSARMVPAGKTFYMTQVNVSCSDNTAIRVRLRSTSTFEETLTVGNFFLFKLCFVLQNSTQTIALDIPQKFPALSIIKATTFSNSVGGAATFSYSGWYE